MKNQLFCILFFLLCSSIGFGQQNKFRDSISRTIKNEVSDSLKTKIYYDAATFSITKKGDLEQGRKYVDSSMNSAIQSSYKELEAKSHFLYGLLDRVEGNYESALNHLNKNIKYFKNDSKNKSYALFQKGVVYRQLGDLEKSLSTYLDILKIFQIEKDSFAMASTMNSVANIYGEMNNNSEAVKNYMSALSIFKKKNEKRDIVETSQSLAVIHHRMGNYDKALKYIELGLGIAKDINLKDMEGSCLMIMGTIQLDLNPNKAIKYLSEAKKKLDSTNFEVKKLAADRALGLAHYEIGNFSTAKKLLKPAFEIANQKKIQNEIKPITKALAEISAKESNFKSAYNYHLKYTIAKDTILNIENSKSINLLSKRFESEKKDKELAERKLELADKEIALTESKSKTRTMSILIVSLLLASILLWFVFQQRQQRIQEQLVTIQREQEVKTLESLMEGEEKERFRIAKELHDGVNGDLAAIKFKLTSLLETNNQVINEAVTMIDNSCEQVRAISHNLVPPSLKDFNLLEAVEEYCQSMNSIHEPSIEFQQLGNPIELDKKQEANVFRIVQELVTNSIKHAEAKEINVQLSHLNDTLQLTVEDNGKGFDPKTVKSDGIGMQNVQSRVDYLNATMDFLSNEKGTSYTITMDTKTATS